MPFKMLSKVRLGMCSGICSLVSATMSLLAGCSVYHSSVNEGDSSSLGEGAVLAHGALQPYFLPRGFIRLEIKETKAAKQDESSKKTAAGGATGNDESDSGKTAAADTKATGKGSNDATPTTPVEPTLPDMPVTDVAAAWSGTAQIHIRLTTILAPDHRRGPIYSRFVGNALSHDQPKLDVNERHLLSSTTTTTEDKSAQIISDLTDTAINIVKIGSLRMAPAPQKEVITEPIDIDITFDPMDFEAVRRVNDSISSSTGFSVHVNGQQSRDYIAFRHSQPEEAGLRFRLPMACDVVLEFGRSTKQAKRIVHSATLPDPSREYLFVVSRGAFISKTTHIRVKDGMARGFDVDKPSEIQGFTGMLVNITGKIVAVPKDLLSARIEYTKKEKELSDSQLELLKAQQANEAALKAQSSPSPPPH
jgi:hypothetical protein